MDWEPRKLSPRAQIALLLSATGLPQTQAAAQAGISKKQFQRVAYSVLGRKFLREQQALFLEELRRARLVWRLEQESGPLGRELSLIPPSHVRNTRVTEEHSTTG